MGEGDMLCMQIYTSCFLKNYEAINLCGKAVYMRQIAKLSLLRQIGRSFLYYTRVTNWHGVTYQPLQDDSSWARNQHLAFGYCVICKEKDKNCNQSRYSEVFFGGEGVVVDFRDRNYIIANLILLESRAVKDIKKACFNMEINLPPPPKKNLHAFSNEVRVMSV